jgi:hypothetical protein
MMCVTVLEILLRRSLPMSDNCQHCGYPLVAGTCDNLCDEIQKPISREQEHAMCDAERPMTFTELCAEIDDLQKRLQVSEEGCVAKEAEIQRIYAVQLEQKQQLDEARAWIEQAKTQGECVHCGELLSVDETDRNHWETCESHPACHQLSEARARCAEVTANYERYVNDVRTAEEVAIEKLTQQLSEAQVDCVLLHSLWLKNDKHIGNDSRNRVYAIVKQSEAAAAGGGA